MTETRNLSRFASIANAAFNSMTANSTAILSMSVGGASINATSFAGTANNASNLGGVAAASYQLNSTLSANVATLTANNTSFVGTVSAANVVSNAQLSANLANYQTTAGLSANVATLTANSATFANSSSTNTFTVGTAAYFVANGNLGIGTASPNATLAVVGTANVSGNVTVGGSISAANVTATVFTGSLTGTASSVTNGVYTTGDQTIGSTKNFSGSLRNIVSSGWSNFYLGGGEGSYLWMHIGGDLTNELRFGRVNRSTFNWEANPFIMNMSSGIFTVTGDIRAPIFYDSNDTAWYCNPNGLSRLVNLQLAVNNWNSTTEGWNRLYFASGDSSIYQGGSTGQWSHQFRNSDGNTRWLMEAAGNFWASGNITAYWSDKRLKKNIEKITDWRSIINGLNGYRYEWNDIGCKVLENSESGVQVGLIAQEVQEVLPQAAAIQMMQYKGKNPDGTYEPKDGIDYDPENPYLTVREEKLIPVLVEAIKGVLQELDDLKVKYERLENLARGNI